MLTSQSYLTQATSAHNSLPEVAFPPCSKRSLQYYLDCAEGFLLKKTSLSKEAWQQFKQSYGVSSFIDNCIKILAQWEKIPVVIREKIRNLPFPDYLPFSTAINLLKIKGENFLGFFTSLEETFELQGYLCAKDISRIAKMFHLKTKRYLCLEEVMNPDDWQVVAKRFRLIPTELSAIQEKSKALAAEGTVFTDHVVQVLIEDGYDASLILPKPKKQFTQRDIDSAVASYREENEYLKRQIAELENKTLFNGQTTSDVSVLDVSPYQPEETPVDSEELITSDEVPFVTTANESEETSSYLEDEESGMIESTSETLTNIEYLSSEDLTGRRVIYELNGTEKTGHFVGQNGTRFTGHVRTNNKSYCLNLSQIRVEHPVNSGQYYPADTLLNIGGKSKHSTRLSSFRDLLPNKNR